VYELGYRICVDGWQEAVAWRLASALDSRAWNALAKRQSGLCRLLADLANEVEDSAKVLGEAAGLACADAMRWFGLPRLVQKVAQTIVAKSLPPVGEELTDTLSRQLRIVGIWSCASTSGALETCPCFADLVRGQTREWIEAALSEGLTSLRSTLLQ
jgi:hypothetical protein